MDVDLLYFVKSVNVVQCCFQETPVVQTFNPLSNNNEFLPSFRKKTFEDIVAFAFHSFQQYFCVSKTSIML